MAVIRRLVSGLQKAIITIFFDLPARWMGIDRLIARLEKSGQGLEKKNAAVKGRSQNQETLAHIIGIERWGQRRLRVALGESLVADEYDRYRPDAQDWPALKNAFHSVRQETISLSKSLRMAGVDCSTRITHNQFGEISLLGWLLYLNLHASIESLRIS